MPGPTYLKQKESTMYIGLGALLVIIVLVVILM